MSFQRKRKVYVLDFADTDLDGLTVRARTAPLGTAMQLGSLGDRLFKDDTLGAAGLFTLDLDELFLILGAYQKALAAVPDPLPQASTAGSPSLVGSMPMEPLSESQAS